MIKDSNDVNRASLDLANKVKYTEIYVCVYIKKKKYRKCNHRSSSCTRNSKENNATHTHIRKTHSDFEKRKRQSEKFKKRRKDRLKRKIRSK